VRGFGASSVSRLLRLTGLPFFAPNEVFDGPELKAVSSEIVFQAPQESQRPDHLLVTAPQSEQE